MGGYREWDRAGTDSYSGYRYLAVHHEGYARAGEAARAAILISAVQGTEETPVGVAVVLG